MDHLTFIAELTRKKRKLKSSWNRLDMLQTNAHNYKFFLDLQLHVTLVVAEIVYDFLGCLCHQIDITHNLTEKMYACHFSDCQLNGVLMKKVTT